MESLELLGDKTATVFRDRSRLLMTLCRVEILARLDSRAQGWTAEELANELYGEAGTTAAICTEMFRSARCWVRPWSRTPSGSLPA